MLTAKRKSDNQKVIGDFIEKSTLDSYFCEYCDKEVVHHKSKSKIKIGHFKHKPGHSFCPNYGETIVHIQTKLQIYQFIEEQWGSKLSLIELEKWICNKSIRPDIYIVTKKLTKIAIEVQASALTVDEIKRRTEKYYNEGIYVLWVLPFEYTRFFEYKRVSGWDENGVWRLLEGEYDLADKIRLKEYEIFIFWAYYKKLILWDLDQEYSSGFIIVELVDYISEPVEFRRDGEDHYYDGRKSKVMKVPMKIFKNVSFDKFKPNDAKRFDGNRRGYGIPERRILTHFEK